MTLSHPLFLHARAEEVHPSLSPTQVRRRLVAARAGSRAAVLVGMDGVDDRQAVVSMVAGEGGPVKLETLAGNEAIAALDLLDALHRGELASFVVVDGQYWQLDPDYWEPRHDGAALTMADVSHIPPGPPISDPRLRRRALYDRVREIRLRQRLQRGPLLWGEDSLSNHPARPVPRNISVDSTVIHINRALALEWIAATALRAAPVVVSGEALAEECQRVANALTAEGKGIRDVRSPDVARLWSKGVGAPAKVKNVTSLMADKKRGRPATKLSR